MPFLVAALENNLRVYMRAQNPKTMQEIRTAIIHFNGATAHSYKDQQQYAVVDALCSKLDSVVQHHTNVSTVQTQGKLNNHRHQNSHSRTPQNRPQTTQKNNKKDCFFCGGKFYPQLSDCPARGKVCHKCGKANHFARVCRANKA